MTGHKCDRCGYTTQSEDDHIVTGEGELLCLECNKTEKHSITIQWGERSSWGEDNPPMLYEFDTQKEMDAFLMGVDAMDGWMAWQDIRPCPYCKGICLETDDEEMMCKKFRKEYLS
jgi:hypothetical protein